MLKLVRVVNLPRVICRHLIGEHHTTAHRMVVGACVMAGGVAIAEIEVKVHIIHMGLELGGYAIHALGAAPYIEWLLTDE